MQTTIAIKDLSPGLAKAVNAMNPKGRDVTITARDSAVPSTDSQIYHVANVIVADIDNPATVTVRRGVWGGNNGFNKPPADVAFDPVFDNTSRPVPVGGAIVVGTIGRYCNVYVHTQTFALRFTRHEVVRDALLEGRTAEAQAIQANEAELTDAECAILYAHGALKSGEYRKRVVTAFSAALEACISRGLIKRSANGACAITTQGKAMRDAWRNRGEKVSRA